MSFDEHSENYSQQVDQALTGVGLEHDFFLEAKVRYILEARRRVAGNTPVRVLEIGCGIGLLTRRLRALFTDVWGIDPSVPSLRKAGAQGGRLIAADGFCTPFLDETFDLVIVVCVLHHVPVAGRAAFLAEAARVTRRGGVVLLCEHNAWNPLTRAVVGRCEFDRDAVLLALPEARRRLMAAGLSRVTSRYILFFPWRGAFWRWLEAGLGWFPLGAQYVTHAVRE